MTEPKKPSLAEEVERMGEILENVHRCFVRGDKQSAQYELGCVRVCLSNIAREMRRREMKEPYEEIMEKLRGFTRPE